MGRRHESGERREVVALLRQCSVALVGAVMMLPPVGGETGDRAGGGEMVPTPVGATEFSRPISSPDLQLTSLASCLPTAAKASGGRVLQWWGQHLVRKSLEADRSARHMLRRAGHEMQTQFAGVRVD